MVLACRHGSLGAHRWRLGWAHLHQLHRVPIPPQAQAEGHSPFQGHGRLSKPPGALKPETCLPELGISPVLVEPALPIALCGFTEPAAPGGCIPKAPLAAETQSQISSWNFILLHYPRIK